MYAFVPKSPSNNSLHGTQNLRRLQSTGRWRLQYDSDIATPWRNVLTSIFRVEEVRKKSFNIGKVMNEQMRTTDLKKGYSANGKRRKLLLGISHLQDHRTVQLALLSKQNSITNAFVSAACILGVPHRIPCGQVK